MKISDESLSILKYMSAINSGIVFKKGSTVKVVIPGGGQFHAVATIKEELPVDFAIADVPKFINLISLFDDPDFEFSSDRLVVTDSTDRKMTYRYSDVNTIRTLDYSKGNVKIPAEDVKFKLTRKHQDQIEKAVAILKSSHIAFIGDGTDLNISTYNGSVLDANSMRIPVGKTDRKFEMVFSPSYLKLIPQDYDVVLCLSKTLLARFDGNPTYWVPADIKSKVNE